MKKAVWNLRVACAIAVSAISMAGFALSTVSPSISLEQMTDDADEIIIGSVVAEEATVIGRSFETRYKIQVHENLKAGRGRMAPGQTVLMTLPGAALTSPPITQYVSGVPYMTKGEEVLLFLRNSDVAPPDPQPSRSAERVSRVPSSPKIVGWNQGRFSVLTSPDTGKKMVSRINLENYGLVNSSAGMRGILDAVAAESVPLIEKQITRSADLAREARIKDPLELTNTDVDKLQVERGAQSGAVLKAMRQRGGIAAQYLDDFKADVQQYLND